MGLHYLEKRAEISPDGVYRYSLRRAWGGADGELEIEQRGYSGKALWIMFNPSTADEKEDDPTLRRVVGFSSQWGYACCEVVNLFALRTADPQIVLKHPAPIGPDNDRVILHALEEATDVFVAWGSLGCYLNRYREVFDLIGLDRPVWTLRRTVTGQPGHPLYAPSDLIPFDFYGRSYPRYQWGQGANLHGADWNRAGDPLGDVERAIEREESEQCG